MGVKNSAEEEQIKEQTQIISVITKLIYQEQINNYHSHVKRKLWVKTCFK